MWKPLTQVGREERMLELLLRIGVAGCYVGHGAFGVIGKEAWLPYFAVAGIGPDWAWRLMPLVGSIDILIGILCLLAPRPAFLGYAAGWAVWTALLRPLSGESLFETLERAGNYGVPIAFLIFAGVGAKPTIQWLRTIEIPRLGAADRRDIMLALRVTTATLLLGHGGLALQSKPLLVSHVQALGLPGQAVLVMGAFEVALAIAVAARPAAPLLLVILFWKLGTEALFPFTGAPFWEFVERAGSYIAPVALWTMVRAGTRQSVPVGAPAALAGIFLAGASVGAVSARSFDRAGSTADGSIPGPLTTLATFPVGTSNTDFTLADARAGGLVLACRHAITDRTRRDAQRVDFADPATQRVLSATGEAQARRLGEVIRSRRIPIGDVLASPYARTRDSAVLAFGRVEERRELFGGGQQKRRTIREWLSTPPSDATNRVLMTHQGVLYSALPGVERGSIREGDCVVVRPGGGSFTVLERMGPDEWEALR